MMKDIRYVNVEPGFIEIESKGEMWNGDASVTIVIGDTHRETRNQQVRYRIKVRPWLLKYFTKILGQIAGILNKELMEYTTAGPEEYEKAKQEEER